MEVKKVNIMNVVGKRKRMGRYVGMTAGILQLTGVRQADDLAFCVDQSTADGLLPHDARDNGFLFVPGYIVCYR